MFAGPSISQNGIAEVKVYADSLIGSRRLAFGTANIAFAAILRCSRTRDDAINRDQSRPMDGVASRNAWHRVVSINRSPGVTSPQLMDHESPVLSRR